MDIDIPDKPDQKPGNPGKKNENDGNAALRNAVLLFKKKGTSRDFQKIIEILNVYTELHPGDVLANKLLAFSLCEIKSYEEARLVFRSIYNNYPDETDVLNALAWLGLQDGNTEESINYLLDAIYIDKNNLQLKKNLEDLKNLKDPRVFFRMSRSRDFLFTNLPRETAVEKIERDLNNVLKSPLARTAVILASVIFLCLIIYRNYPGIVNLFEEYRFKKGLGQGRVTHVTIQDINKIIDERKLYNIKLSEQDIKKKFDLLNNYMEEKKRNQAMMLINELLNSNASDYVKERVLVLKEVMPDIDINKIDYQPSVQEVTRIPFLYQDVYVRWYGTVANLEHKERRETVFDLLINFIDNAVVEGIAESHFQGFQNITSGEKVGIVGLVAGITIDNKIIVKGLQIQRLDNR